MKSYAGKSRSGRVKPQMICSVLPYFQPLQRGDQIVAQTFIIARNRLGPRYQHVIMVFHCVFGKDFMRQGAQPSPCAVAHNGVAHALAGCKAQASCVCGFIFLLARLRLDLHDDAGRYPFFAARRDSQKRRPFLECRKKRGAAHDCGLWQLRLGGQPLTALGAAARDDFLAAFGGHAGPIAMPTLAHELAGLIRTFHETYS